MMFTDIVGLSNLAEVWRSEENCAFLNAHFLLMSAAIDRTGGTIDKYLGDGLLACWGAPSRQTDYADRAIQTALAIRQEMAAENE
ncbi:MAG: adenylate/guanylate cyclase domain-containing protein, partial [Pseudomonadota bacterium]